MAPIKSKDVARIQKEEGIPFALVYKKNPLAS